jgi:26S proteasome regulatory subunit N10
MDNSEYMRNSDYAPSRLEAQQDAAGVISNTKIISNPENTVGVLSMAGKGVELLVSPTEDSGKVLACFGQIRAEGMLNFSASVQIAQLALKHRKNKNGGQRIIAFVGSPVAEDVAALQKVGKQLKKNNVAVNVVSMGEFDDNNEKLTEFINAVNSNDNSSFVVVPPGVVPQNAVRSSLLDMGGGAPSGGAPGDAGASGGGDDFGGIDESMDPELAMAMRISMEEARAAAASSSNDAPAEGAADAASSSSSSEGGAAAAPATEFGGAGAATEDDEDALMQQALALSMQGMSTDSPNAAEGAATPAAADVSGSFAGMGAAEGDDEEMDEDALMQQALALSMSSGAAQPPAAPSAGDAGAAAAGDKPTFLNPEFVRQLFGDTDVDLNDPIIRAALEQFESESKGKEEGDADSKKRKKDE